MKELQKVDLRVNEKNWKYGFFWIKERKCKGKLASGACAKKRKGKEHFTNDRTVHCKS